MKKFLAYLIVALVLAIPASPSRSACAFLCNDGKGNGTFGANLTVTGTLTAGAFAFGTPGAAGTILRSNGTAWIPSTATYPDTQTINQVLYGTAANAIGSGTGLTFDGTTLTANTATVSTGNLTVTAGNLISGTNAFVIAPNTSDASDTKDISLNGGGANSTARGAFVQVYGNEHGSL